jgi:putative ABC transport system permease protein
MPMVFGLSLFMTFSGLLSTMNGAMSVVTPGKDFHTAGIDSVFIYLAPALLIALVGVVSGLLIGARERRLDFALLHVSGADVSQLRAVGFLDGVFMMLTAVLLSFLVVLSSTLATGVGLFRMFGIFSISIQVRYWLVVLAVSLSIGALATGIQGLRFNAENSVSVIAETIGE